MRRHTILTPSSRADLFEPSQDLETAQRRYVLDPDDVVWTNAHHRAQNRRPAASMQGRSSDALVFERSRSRTIVISSRPRLPARLAAIRANRSSAPSSMMRALLYEAAQVMLSRVKTWSWLRAWAMNVAKRREPQKAIVALARRLAVIMHRMWSDGTKFR